MQKKQKIKIDKLREWVAELLLNPNVSVSAMVIDYEWTNMPKHKEQRVVHFEIGEKDL